MGSWPQEGMSVRTADGRDLECVVAGPADGMLLFSHHGTPGAAETLAPLVEVGAERGLRHLTYSRPGYGASTRLPGRTVASCAADVAAIADELGYERFYSVGASGGGPHSIACATLLPDRVISVATIGSPAPIDAEGLDWTAGMGQENVAEVAACREQDAEFERYLEREAERMVGASAEEVMAQLGDTVADADRRAVSGVLGEFIVRELAHSVSTGVAGWFDDDRALFGNWGFDIAPVRAPLLLWHGAEDRFVPAAHSQWLAARLGVDALVRTNVGHLSLSLALYDEILDALLASSSGPPDAGGRSRGAVDSRL